VNLLALMKISNYPSDPSHIPDTRKSQIPVLNSNSISFSDEEMSIPAQS